MSSTVTPTVGNGLHGDPLVDRLSVSAHDAVDRAAVRAAPMVGRLREASAQAADSLRATAHDLRRLEEQWAADARTTVRENPLTSVGVAALVGFVVGRLLIR